ELAARADMFNRLPTPYGLVRDGVAPDHQSIKAVTRVFERISADPRFRYFGNVTVGRDLSRADLLEAYDAIVYAVGAPADRRLGIPGEDLLGSHSATEFVWWYNGHPEFTECEFDLSVQRAVVVGNGNVALDVARILVTSPDELARTDIADHALEALRESRIREVVLLGRRGPVQAAFSSPELKEFGKLEGVGVKVDLADLDLDAGSAIEAEEERAARRNYELLEGYARGETPADDDPTVVFRFLVSPVELLADGEGRVRGVRVERNRLVRAEDGSLRPRGTGEEEILEAGLVFRSVGYRGVPLPDVPFDERRGIIPNEAGRVVDPDSGVLLREYVSGWCKRGPTGIIGTNKKDAAETVDALVEDLEAMAREVPEERSSDAVEMLLVERGVDYVSFEDWRALDEVEVARGEPQGRPRVKVCTIPEMMEVVHEARARRDKP
ncbi:MAG: NADP oxidoreductase, partial [Gemmatimonadota bacterium]